MWYKFVSSSCREKYLGSLYFTIRHQSSILPYNKSLRSEIKVKSKGDPKGYCENDSSSPNRGHKRRFHFRSEFSWWEFPSTREFSSARAYRTPPRLLQPPGPFPYALVCSLVPCCGLSGCSYLNCTVPP